MTALVVFLLILYAGLLEFSKNTIVGWILTVLLSVLFFFFRGKAKKQEGWNKKRGLLVFSFFLILLGVNYLITQPPVRQVKVVRTADPEVTEVIKIQQGELTGVYNEAHTARIYAGIPYAAPPVGPLRWKEPQAPESWAGLRTCDTFAPMAMQPRGNVLVDSLSHLLGYHDYEISIHDNYLEAMSEDCLYLNVYTPATDSPELLPVLFYIHGGSLTTGQSYYDNFRGEDLAAQGIIVVSIAYRLGVFGYYAHESLMEESETGTTGNYGLLDQIAALSWVRDNISAFGGDPDQITIAGESAGASSVNALCVSPLAEGMFVRAIAESSGIVAKHPYHTFRKMEDALTMGRDIMDEMGVSDIEQLREIPAEKLVRTAFQNNAMTVDGSAITEMPYVTYEKGENHEQALLNGFNAKEADVFLMNYKCTEENYESLLEPIFGEMAGEAAALVPAGSVTRDEQFIIDAGGEAKGSLNYLYSAAWFSWSHELWSSYLANQEKPVYEYCFTKTNKSISNNHAGELPYVFGNLWRHRKVYDDSDETLSRIMQSYWVNFVKKGDPNGEGLPLWERRTADKKELIELGETIHMAEDQNQDVYALLEKYQASLE